MATYLTMFVEPGYVTEEALSKALGSAGIVTVEYQWYGNQVFVLAMEGNPKLAVSFAKDLVWKAGFRNGTKYKIQEEMVIYYKPEGFIRHRPDPQR